MASEPVTLWRKHPAYFIWLMRQPTDQYWRPSAMEYRALPAAEFDALTAERDDLRAAIKEARDVIATKYGPDGTNNLDKPLLSRLDALLREGA